MLTLGHGQILQSLTSYGITGKENELFINYLFGRKQSVRIVNEIPQPVVCGVPAFPIDITSQVSRNTFWYCTGIQLFLQKN